MQRALRLRKDAALWDTLADVYYHRGEAAMAVRMAERAVTLAPTDQQLAANLARYRRANGAPCDAVENIRRDGYFWLPVFYGDTD